MSKATSLIDTGEWSKFNCWTLNSGELCVRPGLRRLVSPPAGRRWVAGFTIVNDYDGELFHYLFSVVTGAFGVAMPAALRVDVCDENFVIIQTLNLNTNVTPRTVTGACVMGQVMFGSPDMPTLWGMVGGFLRVAQRVPSDNTGLDAGNVPRGIVTSFVNRFVICTGQLVYISDPLSADGGDARTYVAENINQRPGAIFGVHEGAGGMLLCCTTQGVFGLDAGAAAVQEVGSSGGDWRILCHHKTFSYDSTCVVRGRLYALTIDGYMIADVENNKTIGLDDVLQPRAMSPRQAEVDYRIGKMFPGDDGPIVSLPGRWHMHDLSNNLRSWWANAAASTFVGTLWTPAGQQLFLMDDGVYACDGNIDGATYEYVETNTQQPFAVVAGTIPGQPRMNRIIREVHISASNAGQTPGAGANSPATFVAVRALPAQPLETAVPTQEKGIPAGQPGEGQPFIIGDATTPWESLTARLRPNPLTSKRFDVNIGSDDVGIEFGARFAGTRIQPEIDAIYNDDGRPTGRAG